MKIANRQKKVYNIKTINKIVINEKGYANC